MEKMKRKSTLVVLSLALLLVAASRALANSTTYAPDPKTIEQTQPFSTSYVLTITSPSSTTVTFDVTTSVDITPTSWPVGSSAAEAAALVSLDTDSITFTAANEGHDVTISVSVSGSNTPGSYSYTIVSHRPTGPGYSTWGNGAGTLNVVVDAPVVGADGTPPSVTITKPTADQSFTFCTGGTPIDVAFNAQDGESAISAVDADVNGNAVVLSTVTGLGTGNVDASGTYSATLLGGYTLTARATSLGGTGDATQNFSVNFDIMWLPPLSLGKTSKGGSTVPVKFTARDCSGNFVHDESVKVVVFEVTSGGDVQALSGLFGDGSTSVRIDDEAGQYIINFQTAAGVHNYRVDVYFNDFNGSPYKQGSKTFSVR
jgi:hypothetical protein